MKSTFTGMTRRQHLKIAREQGLSFGKYLARFDRWEREGSLTVTARNPDGSPRDGEMRLNLPAMP